MYNLPIDWVRVSDIVFSNFVTLLLGLIMAYAGYRFGKKQSDINWQREKEKLQNQNRIDDIHERINALEGILSDIVPYAEMGIKSNWVLLDESREDTRKHRWKCRLQVNRALTMFENEPEVELGLGMLDIIFISANLVNYEIPGRFIPHIRGTLEEITEKLEHKLQECFT